MSSYNDDEELVNDCIGEIEAAYNNTNRYYHNLAHLENMYAELLPVKNTVSNWMTLLFSIAYHDFIYDPLKNDNEERSAEMASTTLCRINVPGEIISHCKQQILATKRHITSEDADTNYFTDADLAILGAAPGLYKKYATAIRKEYGHYHDLQYNPGRRKVLRYFLSMERIFKTDHFFERYETQARSNLTAELG